MDNINLQLKKITSPVIVCTGKHYQQTQRISNSELFLTIERDIKQIIDSYPEVKSLNYELNHRLNQGSTSPHIEIKLSHCECVSFHQVKADIEYLLWSYNKQVLHSKNGQFYVHYLRFTFSVEKYPLKKQSTLKAA